MVTGTLPYLGEANIKDPLYQHIKAKSPERFWQTWKQYFRSNDDGSNDENNSLQNAWTSDENDFLSSSDDRTLAFQIWQQFLYKIGFGITVIHFALRIILMPILNILGIALQNIIEIPFYLKETEFIRKLRGKHTPGNCQCGLNNDDCQKESQFYHLYSTLQNSKNVIQHNSDEFSDEFKDLV